MQQAVWLSRVVNHELILQLWTSFYAVLQLFSAQKSNLGPNYQENHLYEHLSYKEQLSFMLSFRLKREDTLVLSVEGSIKILPSQPR